MNPIRLAVKSALGLAIMVPPTLAIAQTASQAQPETIEQEIVVTGIRASVGQSLEAKRSADTVQEVITAEDIGKMPDKNVADSLSRVVGITTSSAGANEGGFDENDRVSMRGTNPSLTQTLLNGHAIAAGDWFVLNQVQQVGRSVSYTLLPSELVDRVVVNKSSMASLVEGGTAGSVNIVTRRPLDFKDSFTFMGSVGAVYSDLPSDFQPQLSALVGWKNNSETFGILVQGFSEERSLRRDGVEILGYEAIAPGSAVAIANPNLAGVQYPRMIGAAFFEQERKRQGGLVDIQIAPSDALNIDAQFFFSKVDAANYNRNYLVWGTSFINLGAGQAPLPGYVVENNTLTQASFAPVPGTNYAVYDQISRPDAEATAQYGSLDVSYQFSEQFTLSGQLGVSEGHGKTPTQDVSETNPGTGGGASWALNGTGRAPDFGFNATDNSTPFPGGTPVTFGWIFGAQNVDVEDKEDWAQIDAAFAVDNGAWTDLKFGARYNKHSRESLDAIAQGPTFAGGPTGGGGVDPALYPTTYSHYPSDFNTFGGNFPTNIWYWTPAQLATYNTYVPGDPAATTVQRDLLAREYYQYAFQVEEKNTAAYVQADFKGENWSANIGVRYVETEEDIVTYTQTAASNPDAITTSLFGPFVGIPVNHKYTDVLPSANLKWDLNDELVARFAVAKTMTRPDYSALAGFTDLSPPAVVGGTGSGTGGNPDLEPIRSTNYDAGLEWYFADKSLLAVGLFYMDLDNYVGYGSELKTYLTYSAQTPNGAEVPYLLTVPVNASGRVQGAEFSYQQAITDNFGVAANYTYADGKQTSVVTNGDDRLVGTSKNTYNLSGYFENTSFSARVTYTYRSAFFSGLDRNTAFSQDAIGSLAASLNYTINDNISLSLDGQNLTDETLKYYAANKDQPRAFYKNGAQYYFTVRVKF